ncbi:uncharacterized protein LOC135684868 isoform X2 [Rhopilema esculentum]|uniref:uncharacterized protein LOC135684868 isoform X2 n=1 Tax=Rhopilema esculentum TaxID=499914 RepID=UPI0031D8D304
MEKVSRVLRESYGRGDTTYSNGFGASMSRLRERLFQMCDVFEYIVKLDDAKESRIYGRDVLNSTAKRILDLEAEFLGSLAENLKNMADPNLPSEVDQNNVSETVVIYAKLTQAILDEIKDFKRDIIYELQEKTKAEKKLSAENISLRVDLQREQAESMQHRQNHGYAIAEKNTAHATCRKLEEQLEERAKVIKQLQRDGTIALWKREKQKIVSNINEREARLEKELQKAKENIEDLQNRMQDRVKELTNQIKILKMEKQYFGTVVNSKVAQREEIDQLQRELFLKDRALIVAEGEIQRQQQYFVGFLTGIARDFRLMMSRSNVDESRYNREQKSFALTLEKMIKAAKEGLLSSFRASLPSHYLGIGIVIKGLPIKKSVASKSTELLQKSITVENLLNDERIRKPRLSSALITWREGKMTASERAQELLQETLNPVKHPALIDTSTGSLNLDLAKSTFPETSLADIRGLLSIFRQFDVNGDFHLDTPELLRAVPDTLGRMATSEEIAEAMAEVDEDKSGTIDFYEFVNVYLMLSKGEGKSALFRKKALKALQKTSDNSSNICSIQ